MNEYLRWGLIRESARNKQADLAMSTTLSYNKANPFGLYNPEDRTIVPMGIQTLFKQALTESDEKNMSRLFALPVSRTPTKAKTKTDPYTSFAGNADKYWAQTLGKPETQSSLREVNVGGKTLQAVEVSKNLWFTHL